MLEITEWLATTEPDQKLTKVDVYLESGKAYNCKVEATTTEERTALINKQWSSIREERDEKLKETDWRASSDLTMSDAWKTYCKLPLLRRRLIASKLASHLQSRN